MEKGIPAVLRGNKRPEVAGSAAACLASTVGLLHWLLVGGSSTPAQLRELHPVMGAAVQLLHLLMVGSSCSGRCSCCLQPAPGQRSQPAPVLAFRRADSSLPTAHAEAAAVSTAALIGQVLFKLPQLSTSICIDEADERVLVRSGGLQAQLQQLAWLVVHARRPRAAAAASASVARCSDPGAFLDDAAKAALVPLAGQAAADLPQALVSAAKDLLLRLEATLTEARPAPTCKRCTPQQLRLIVEAVTSFPDTALAAACDHSGTWCLLWRVLVEGSKTLNWRWLPGAMAPAAPAMVAWVLAAAQQLRDAGGGGASEGAAYLADAVLHAVAALGECGALQDPAQDPALTQQLLGAAELAMRSPSQVPRHAMAATNLPLRILTVSGGGGGKAGAHPRGGGGAGSGSHSLVALHMSVLA